MEARNVPDSSTVVKYGEEPETDSCLPVIQATARMRVSLSNMVVLINEEWQCEDAYPMQEEHLCKLNMFSFLTQRNSSEKDASQTVHLKHKYAIEAESSALHPYA
jgi:hypothetical protein